MKRKFKTREPLFIYHSFLARGDLEKSVLLGVIIVSSSFYFAFSKDYKIWKGYKYTETILFSFLFHPHVVLEVLETCASYLVLQFRIITEL